MSDYSDPALDDSPPIRRTSATHDRTVDWMHTTWPVSSAGSTMQWKEIHSDTPVLRALRAMTPLRDRTLRARASVNLLPVINREAALGQRRGMLATVACEGCAGGGGPFAECVVVLDYFAGACCNCHYEGRQSSCHPSLSKKSPQPLTLRGEPELPPLSPTLVGIDQLGPNTPPLPPVHDLLGQSHREEVQENRMLPHPQVIEVTRSEPPINIRPKPPQSHARAEYPAYNAPVFIDLTRAKEPPRKRRQVQARDIPGNLPSSASPLPVAQSHVSNGSMAELCHLRQKIPHLMRIAMQETVARQRLCEQIKHMRIIIMQEQAKNKHLREQIDQSQRANSQEQASNPTLKEQVEQSRCSIVEIQSEKFTVVKNVVVSNAVIEAAVDAREAEIRVGLSNLWGTPEQMKAQAMQMLDYSNTTSSLVSRLVVGSMLQHQEYINEEEHKEMELLHDNAEPSLEIAAIMEEKLAFVLEGPDRDRFVTLDLC